MLRNGYRGFNPVLRRFVGMDSMSPFGLGGMNGFEYCSGDSINNTDTSGHGIFINICIALAAAIKRNIRRVEEVTPEIRSAARNFAPRPPEIAITDGEATVSIDGFIPLSSSEANNITGSFIHDYLLEEHQFKVGIDRDRFDRRVGNYIFNKKEKLSITSEFELRNGKLDNFTVYIRGYNKKNRIYRVITEINVDSTFISEFEETIVNEYTPGSPGPRRNAIYIPGAKGSQEEIDAYMAAVLFDESDV